MSTDTTARILIVDDETAHTLALSDTLSHEGYVTAGFSSAREALASLRQQEFDLVLTDLKMPEMDGITLLAAARDIDPNLVGIIMTGQGSIVSAVEAMKAGAFDYILKPFKISFILPVLSRALSMRRLRMENADLQRGIQARTAELIAANEELEAFSHSISHDLRAPLRGISGFIGLLKEDYSSLLPEEANSFLNRVAESATEMNDLIDDLMRFSRFSHQSLTKENVDMSALVHNVVDQLRPALSERQVEVETSVLPNCFADVALLKQVLINLVSNAFKYTRMNENAKIEIGSQQIDGEIVYFVRDNGAGFDMRLVKKLFRVFQRLHKSSEFEGTGVGLSIAHRIVRRHGGRIWAEAEVGKGACFFFTLAESRKGSTLVETT